MAAEYATLPDDAEFIARFEACDLDDFPHVAHVRLVCVYLDRHSRDETLALLLRGLARFAESKGKASRFHYTITAAWLELIVAARRRFPDASDAAALLAACPLLADPKALSRYYSDGVLSSAAARADWVPPDRAAFDATV